jgi:hypothetical protein
MSRGENKAPDEDVLPLFVLQAKLRWWSQRQRGSGPNGSRSRQGPATSRRRARPAQGSRRCAWAPIGRALSLRPRSKPVWSRRGAAEIVADGATAALPGRVEGVRAVERGRQAHSCPGAWPPPLRSRGARCRREPSTPHTRPCRPFSRDRWSAERKQPLVPAKRSSNSVGTASTTRCSRVRTRASHRIAPITPAPWPDAQSEQFTAVPGTAKLRVRERSDNSRRSGIPTRPATSGSRGEDEHGPESVHECDVLRHFEGRDESHHYRCSRCRRSCG